MLMVTVVDGMG